MIPGHFWILPEFSTFVHFGLVYRAYHEHRQSDHCHIDGWEIEGYRDVITHRVADGVLTIKALPLPTVRLLEREPFGPKTAPNTAAYCAPVSSIPAGQHYKGQVAGTRDTSLRIRRLGHAPAGLADEACAVRILDTGFLPQIRVQQIEGPARCGTERTDDDRAITGQQVCHGSQCPRSGTVDERQPGQVQNEPLGWLIDDLCCVHQEARNREKVQLAA
jgi:hypothetical protein